MRALLLALYLLMGTGVAGAVLPDEVLPDPALETRAREISAGVRCMVCQNQSIDDSEATLARDLRLLVRERLVAGDSDDQVIQFLVDRYGEFILLEPRFSVRTWILWSAPAFFLLAGALIMWRRSRRALMSAPAGLTKDEQKALDDIMRQG
jgi:cytochrome c-type biogenesis protein CcmH